MPECLENFVKNASEEDVQLKSHQEALEENPGTRGQDRLQLATLWEGDFLGNKR